MKHPLLLTPLVLFTFAAIACSPGAFATSASPSELKVRVKATPDRSSIQTTGEARAAIVWQYDSELPGRHRSLWIERDGNGAKVIAQRPEVVLVSTKSLWIFDGTKVNSLECAECEMCSEPAGCTKNVASELTMYRLKSLCCGTTYELPDADFEPSRGCEEQVAAGGIDYWIGRAVGPIVWLHATFWEQSCGAPHPMFGDSMAIVNLDTLEPPTLMDPAEICGGHEQEATDQLAGCALDDNDTPDFFRASARYTPEGKLEGVCEFTKPSMYMCGNGPGHYTAVASTRSNQLDPVFAPYDNLPNWVADKMKSLDTEYGFLISDMRYEEALAEFRSK